MSRGRESAVLLFVAAESRELKGLLRLCNRIRKLNLPLYWASSAELNGDRIVMVANGAGGERAAKAVELASADASVRAAVSIGFCGALDPALKVGDVFVAESVQSSDAVFPARMPQFSQHCPSGPLASIDRIAQTAQEKRALRANGAAVVEMEAAGVARQAALQDLPFYCVRSVTDLAEESFTNDFNTALRPDGRFDTMRLLRKAGRRPFVMFPELVQLRKRCEIASRTLGEFLADCRF